MQQMITYIRRNEYILHNSILCNVLLITEITVFANFIVIIMTYKLVSLRMPHSLRIHMR